ncbi:MAG: hypothetical protein M3N08_03900 [Pseudomonadota bacterium]|nr:hypothetical protein [Pseudomonadota bacterium]
MRVALAGLFWLLTLPIPVSAQTIPPAVLDKDFATCMAGADLHKDFRRREYCACIRDSERNWTLDTYGRVALEASKARDAAHMPAQLQEIARVCNARVAE